ncbi:hypothetical protein ACI3L1_03430 [Deinococcus sp. SM5_A1]|uniref:hypothetical protein n=1 Tax=Deinococcus sp. SM5_A1 TaxID=3379094 RepID=UPI00385F1AF8
MTNMQAAVRRIADASTARALRQNVAFLTLFMEPRSPAKSRPQRAWRPIWRITTPENWPLWVCS